MKMFKKVLSLVLATVLSLSLLTACGNGSANTFKIGGIGPLSGDVAVYGLAVRNGAQIAVDEINAAGGIGGVEIEFKMEDDVHNPETAVNAYNSLKDWGMKILMGTVTSGPCTAVVAYSSADNMFQLTPSASSLDVVKDNTNVFQMCFTDPNQGIVSADFIGQGLTANDGSLVTKVAVIYDNADNYSSGIYTKFVEAAANQSFEIVSAEAFTGENSTDFTVQVQKARDAGAQLVFLPIYYQAASLILAQAATIDYNPIYFGCDGLDGILSVENFDTSLAEGVMHLTPFDANAADAKTKAFVAEFQKRHGEVPNQFAANAYDAIYTLKAAIEQSDVKPNMSITEMGDALINVINQMSINGITGNNMTWSVGGEVNKAPKVMIIQNGAYVEL